MHENIQIRSEESYFSGAVPKEKNIEEEIRTMLLYMHFLKNNPLNHVSSLLCFYSDRKGRDLVKTYF